MRRGYIIYPIIISSLILAPATAYDGRWGITGVAGKEQSSRNKPQKDISKKVNTWFKNNKKPIFKGLRNLGKTGVDSMLPE